MKEIKECHLFLKSLFDGFCVKAFDNFKPLLWYSVINDKEW